MIRMLVGAAAALLFAAQASAAEVNTFAVRGGTGATAYAGIVRVTTVPLSGDAPTLFMNVEWTFGAYVLKGYGIVSKDDPTLLTVSYVVPIGLGVGRYKVQPDGSVTGTLVGEQGIFVQEVWTRLDAPRAAPPALGPLPMLAPPPIQDAPPIQAPPPIQAAPPVQAAPPPSGATDGGKGDGSSKNN